MNDLERYFPKDLYHSYVIEGDPNEIAYSLLSHLENRGEINKLSPDVLFNLYDSFASGDVQKIKDWHQNKPIDGKKKVCIIGSKYINHEAEQSLLKIIEEPLSDTHFFLIVPDSSLLLGTILSRVQLIKNIGSSNNILDEFAESFYKSTPQNRIDKIGELVKEFKDSENSGGLRFKATTLINDLEKIVYEKWKKDINNNNLMFILKELKNCRDYLSTPGASVKMILEHISLVI